METENKSCKSQLVAWPGAALQVSLFAGQEHRRPFHRLDGRHALGTPDAGPSRRGVRGGIGTAVALVLGDT